MTASHGFEILSERKLPEINAAARHYRHLKTGAELLSLLSSDENKVFGVTFATPPVIRRVCLISLNTASCVARANFRLRSHSSSC